MNAVQNVLNEYELGTTGIKVTPIGLGVMQLSGGGGLFGAAFPVMEQREKTALIEAALAGGINWFDTAELYGFGLSERSLSTALHDLGVRDENVVIATKWFPILRTARNIPRSINTRLENLNGYTIDLYMVHNPGSFSSREAEMDAMAGLVAEGKIRSVGVSNFNPEQMRRAHAALAAHHLPLAVNQVHYSLAHRSIETDGVLETAKELGVTIVAYTPLGYGLLTGIYHKDPSLVANKNFFYRQRIQRQIEPTRPLVDALIEIAESRDVTPAQVALNWLVTFHGDAVVTIPGATKVSHVQQSAGAMSFRLTKEELARLDELSRVFL
jgi:aryl-alcohol dehydrogenase-like predicted oxidoreductase